MYAIRSYYVGNSYIDFMSYNANNNGVKGDFNAGSIGYNSYLLNETGNGGYEPILFGDTKTLQTRTYEEKGYLNEWNMSVSGNIDSKYYLGASLNIQDLYYRRKITHDEVFLNTNPTYQIYNPNNGGFENASEGDFTYYDNLKTTGTGVSATFGGIARILDNLRVGYSVKTPTRITSYNVCYTKLLRTCGST